LLKMSPKAASQNVPNRESNIAPNAVNNLNGHSRPEAVSNLPSGSEPGSSVSRETNVRGSFIALKKAAALKRDSFKIWQNLLSVSVQMTPPPFSDIVLAQSRLIEILGNVEGERCIDIPIVESLLHHIINEPAPRKKTSGQPQHQTGLEKLVIDLIQKKIMPLVTNSRRLWMLIAKLDLYLQRPQAALSAYEKAWRAQLNQPSWDTGFDKVSKERWGEVSGATIDLIDAYERLGERSREAGMGEGEIVAKDWKFKARNAARTVQGRAKEAWEEDEAYELLTERLKQLKGA